MLHEIHQIVPRPIFQRQVFDALPSCHVFVTVALMSDFAGDIERQEVCVCNFPRRGIWVSSG